MLFLAFLFSDVLSYMFFFKPDRGYRIASCPNMFSREIPLFAAEVSDDGNRALTLDKPDDGGYRVLRRDGDEHVLMIRHKMPLDNL